MKIRIAEKRFKCTERHIKHTVLRNEEIVGKKNRCQKIHEVYLHTVTVHNIKYVLCTCNGFQGLTM